MSLNPPLNQPEQIGFLLAENFSMLSLAAVLEPLRMANRLAESELYQWHFYCPADRSVSCSNGLPFSPTRLMNDSEGLAAVILFTGIGATEVQDPSLFSWLRALSRRGVPLGATSTASVLLARAGLLKQHACTIHWENIESFREEFPALNVTGELFEIDAKFMTCSGGLAGLDMMLQLIAYKHGEQLAKDISEQCIHPKIRGAHEQQRMELQLRHRTHHPRLVKALELMRNSIDEPLTCQEIGRQVGLSSRQLERLCREQLDQSPASYYMAVRLERARHLLQQSTLSVLQVATACGFSSTSYFSRCYRKQFQRTPREERKAPEAANN